jgi:hypothetical protein
MQGLIMANPWFRMYAEFATDPKVQRLSEQNQRRLTMIFCLRCNGDVTLHDEDVTFMLRISHEEWIETKALFIERGFINNDNEVLNWDKRQYISDSSSERVARHRAKQKIDNVTDVTSCNVTVTPPEQIHNRTDTDKNIVINEVDNCPHKEIINLYALHLPMLTQVKVWSDSRSRLLKARWREDTKRQNLEWWDRFFKFVSQSNFLTGKSTDWQADIEWILNSKNFIKILEGKYDNKVAA